MRRVSVHTGREFVDLTLPSGMPLAELLPRLCDIVDRVGGPRTDWPRRLHTPGGDALDPAKTLSDSGIRDGDILVLSASEPPAPPRVTRDAAQRLARAATAETASWDGRTAALLIATVLAGTAGLTALSGTPGAPHLLLAASAAGGTAAVAARLSQCRTLFAGLASGAALTAAAALCATILAADPHRAGVMLAVLAVAILVSATRVTLTVCGLTRAAAADLTVEVAPAAGAESAAVDCLAAIVSGAAGAAAIGVVIAAAAGGPLDCALGAMVSAAVLLRARAHHAPIQRRALLGGGICGAAATLVALARLEPAWCPWLCLAALTAATVAVAVAYRPVRSPGFGEALAVTEYAGLAAVLPLACWTLGVFDALGPVR